MTPRENAPVPTVPFILIVYSLGQRGNVKAFGDFCKKHKLHFYCLNLAFPGNPASVNTTKLLHSPEYAACFLGRHCIPWQINDAWYKKVAEGAGVRDTREEIAEFVNRSSKELQARETKAVALYKAATCIIQPLDTISMYFIERTDPRLVAYADLSFFDMRRKGEPLVIATRGGMFGESVWFTDSQKWSRDLAEHSKDSLLAEGADIKKTTLRLKSHEPVGAYEEPRFKKIKSAKSAVPKTDPQKTVFVPLHCSWDLQLLQYSPLWGSNHEFLQDVLDALPEDYTVLVKQHPLAYFLLKRDKESVVDLIEKDKRCIQVSNNVYDVFPRVRFVATINSSVGLEALFCNKHAVVGGKALYSYIPGGYVIAAHHSREFFKEQVRKLATEDLPPVDDELTLMALGYMWKHLFFNKKDSAAFANKCGELILPLFSRG